MTSFKEDALTGAMIIIAAVAAIELMLMALRGCLG